MVEPSKPEKKQEQEKITNEKEDKTDLGVVSQLIQYVPRRHSRSSSALARRFAYVCCGASLWIFGFFILNQDWLKAAIVFPVMVIMVAWSAYSRDFWLQVQQTADFSGVDLSGVDLSGADLSGANLRYANLCGANLCGANLSRAEFRYADLSGADLGYVDLTEANLKYANLRAASLYCTLLNGANLSDANLSEALLFFTNLREAIDLEPFQLKAKPLPFLCNVALPNYSQSTNVNPNRACDRFPQLLSDRYNISLEEAQRIVDEALQHRWN